MSTGRRRGIGQLSRGERQLEAGRGVGQTLGVARRRPDDAVVVVVDPLRIGGHGHQGRRRRQPGALLQPVQVDRGADLLVRHGAVQADRRQVVRPDVAARRQRRRDPGRAVEPVLRHEAEVARAVGVGLVVQDHRVRRLRQGRGQGDERVDGEHSPAAATRVGLMGVDDPVADAGQERRDHDRQPQGSGPDPATDDPSGPRLLARAADRTTPAADPLVAFGEDQRHPAEGAEGEVDPRHAVPDARRPGRRTGRAGGVRRGPRRGTSRRRCRPAAR